MPGAVDRIEARFSGLAFSPHRHDRYAIGITLGGVQSFDDRGATRHSMPGQVVVLHPDELHDGRAGDGTAFRYRTAIRAIAAPALLPIDLPESVCCHTCSRRRTAKIAAELTPIRGGQ